MVITIMLHDLSGKRASLSIATSFQYFDTVIVSGPSWEIQSRKVKGF